MLEVVIDWMANHWLELASVVIAIVALFYAALAYNSSRDTATAARTSELVNLRIQAKSSLAEAKRSFLSLRSSCQASRADWDQYARKHLPSLGSRPVVELSSISQVQREGAALLREVSQYFAPVDEMEAAQLEKGFQDAKAAALEIERLAGRLEGPPTPFN